MQKKVDVLVKWLQDQMKETGVKGLLVGISGGIDSAVVTNLIKLAAPDSSLGIMMPCKSNPTDLAHATEVAEKARIDHLTIDLSRTHDVLLSDIKTELVTAGLHNPDQEKLSDANLRARLRMSTLYTVATNHQYLVVGTDNAAEWFTGYFTKFGDGGVDLAPLAHLTKGEVREMAKYLGVPNVVIEKQPSAGLWEGQTDENEMGTTYEYIDKYLKGEEIPEKDKSIIEEMNRKTAHKREIVKIPPKF